MPRPETACTILLHGAGRRDRDSPRMARGAELRRSKSPAPRICRAAAAARRLGLAAGLARHRAAARRPGALGRLPRRGLIERLRRTARGWTHAETAAFWAQDRRRPAPAAAGRRPRRLAALPDAERRAGAAADDPCAALARRRLSSTGAAASSGSPRRRARPAPDAGAAIVRARRCKPRGGHATLVVAPDGDARARRGVRAAKTRRSGGADAGASRPSFDPMGVLNPGRMREGV